MKHHNSCLTLLTVLCVAGIIAQVDISSAFAIEKVPAIIDGKPASQAADLYASEPERLRPVECGSAIVRYTAISNQPEGVTNLSARNATKIFMPIIR